MSSNKNNNIDWTEIVLILAVVAIYAISTIWGQCNMKDDWYAYAEIFLFGIFLGVILTLLGVAFAVVAGLDVAVTAGFIVIVWFFITVVITFASSLI